MRGEGLVAVLIASAAHLVFFSSIPQGKDQRPLKQILGWVNQFFFTGRTDAKSNKMSAALVASSVPGCSKKTCYSMACIVCSIIWSIMCYSTQHTAQQYVYVYQRCITTMMMMMMTMA